MKEAVKKEGIWHPNLEVNLFLALFGSLYIKYSEDRDHDSSLVVYYAVLR